MKYCRDIHSSLSVFFYEDGIEYTPCCYVRPRFTHDNSPLQFNTIFQDLRNDNKAGKPLGKMCRECVHYESQGMKSKRQSVNELHNNEEVYDVVGPEYIEILLDFTCNAACLTCSPRYSSYWKRYTNDKVSHLSNDFSTVEHFFSELDLSILKKVQITGGEPFLSSRNELFLNYIVEHCDPSQVSLMYHTNGSVIPNSNVIELFKKFRLVEIYISIDDVRASFNYMRFPLHWKSVVNNIYTLYEIMPSNVMFNIERTISLLNIHRLGELEEWFEATRIKTNRFGDQTNLINHNAFGPFAPREISQKHYDWLEKNHPDALKWVQKPKLVALNNELAEFVLDQDKRRGMDINKVFPEFLSFYKSP